MTTLKGGKRILNTNSKNRSSAVAIYNTHTDTEAAVKDLQTAGIEMDLLSVVGKDYRTEDHVVGYYRKTDDRLKYSEPSGAESGAYAQERPSSGCRGSDRSWWAARWFRSSWALWRERRSTMA
jgi:hypothetical protein